MLGCKQARRLGALIALAHLFGLVLPAPVPIPKEENQIEGAEDGLLLLVPTVPVNDDGQPVKREVDYELISIPGDVIRRTVREVTEAHGANIPAYDKKDDTKTSPDNDIASIFISDTKSSLEDEELLIKHDVKFDRHTNFSSSSESTDYQLIEATLNSLRSVPSTYGSNDDIFVGSHSTNSYNTNPLSAISTVDLSKILSSVLSTGLSTASSSVNLAGQAKTALSTASQVGQSALVGGTQAVRWVLKQKAAGLRSAAELTSTGLQYAGRLSSALLKVLLKVPGIKARVISEVIQAGQPLATAVSDVISDSADDLGDIFEAQSDIFRDAVNILFRLIQDVLALKGRIFASFSASGLDKGASLINAGVKVGSAFVQSAGDVISSVGRGVGELIQVASEANIPKPPPLPSIKLPQLPTISYPSHQESSDSYSNKGVVQTYGAPS